jgi:TPR repeat protein
MYEDGLGVETDLAVAGLMYKKAVDKGYARSGRNLFWLYWNAESFPDNKSKALAFCLWTVDQEEDEARNDTLDQCNQFKQEMIEAEISLALEIRDQI